MAVELTDAESVAREAAKVCACLDEIRADGEGWCDVSVPWRECLPRGILECAEPRVVAYLQEWERADARDEAYVREGLAAGDEAFPPTVWERRTAAATLQRAKRAAAALSSSSSSSSDEKEEDDYDAA